MSKIDVDRGVTIKFGPESSAKIYMYKDDPGIYYDENGNEVGSGIAKRAGYDVGTHATIVGKTMLYHPTEAPEGQTFDSATAPLEALEKEGWVDNPGKIGINLWDSSAEEAIREKKKQYQNGEIPGMDATDKGVRCAIWNTLASDETEGGYDGKSMDSPCAGGRYSITGTAIEVLQKHDSRLKARLTSWLVEQRRLGVKCPEITTTTIKDVKQKRNLSVRKRADQLLRYIENATPNIGSGLAFGNQNISTTAMAWSESTDMDEVKSLLSHLKKRGWLEGGESTDEKYVLTIEGHARLEELERTDTESGQAFVAMWFHASTDCAWEQGIKLGIEDAGYKPIRVDQEEFNNKIDDKIIAEIKRSRFIVADFTQGGEGPRGGVYYEAGFAHGLDIPVIFTCRKDALGQVHFDTRQYNHIVWEKPQELRERLEARISDSIGDGPYKEK